MQLNKLFLACLIGLSSFAFSATDLPLENVGSKQIYLSKDYRNWFEAFQFCASHGLQLIAIDNSLDNFYISEYLKPIQTGWIWISATDFANPGEWMWMSTGQALTFNNSFSPLENGGGDHDNCYSENCLALAFVWNCMTWIDAECTGRYKFLCETI